jgi:fumarate reductase subunit C
VHAAIGLRAVAVEWARATSQAADAIMWGAGIGLLLLGLRAVAAVVLA